jgi:DNA polymerase-3 subunit epsilon
MTQLDRNLGDLTILLVDCQATGSTPASGHLLELGWCATSAARVTAGAALSVTSHLLALPDGESLPPHISRLTGITHHDLDGALDPRRAWSLFGEEAATVASGDDRRSLCVAHYARLEERFLRHLHAGCAGCAPFPLRFLCTHEVARRIVPDLPRRGLRALAGYFGSTLNEIKRTTPHVLATARVWAGLVELLRDEHGVHTLAELHRLLEREPPPRPSRWSYPLAREKRLGLSDAPGVYRFLAADGTVLYVGKATSLKSRVNSYYRSRRAADKVLELVSQVHEVETTVTTTCLEAALLENEEIKRHDPPFNKALRSGGREVRYFSHDLASEATARDRRHPVGPLPSRDSLRGVAALAAYLDGGGVGDELMRAMGLEPRWLRPGAFVAGVEAFAAAHRELLDALPTRLALLGLGTCLWRRRLAERDAERAEGGAASDEPDGDAPLLTLVAPPSAPSTEPAAASAEGGGRSALDPSAVVEHIEGWIRSATHLVRRARWFVLLAGATVRWRPGDGDGESWRSLQAADAPLPADRATYDRLRVLTTEIRRLVAGERDVEVDLPTGRTLDCERLRRLMRMI